MIASTSSDLLADFRHAARLRLDSFEAFAVECAERGMDYPAFLAAMKSDAGSHPYSKLDGDTWAYDGSALNTDLSACRRDLRNLYESIFSTHRPRTQRELDEIAQAEAHYATISARRASMPPVYNGRYHGRLTDSELARAKRAGARMRRAGHVPVGYFSRTTVGKLLACACASCGRWIAIDTEGRMSGSAYEESCSH